MKQALKIISFSLILSLTITWIIIGSVGAIDSRSQLEGCLPEFEEDFSGFSINGQYMFQYGGATYPVTVEFPRGKLLPLQFDFHYRDGETFLSKVNLIPVRSLQDNNNNYANVMNLEYSTGGWIHYGFESRSIGWHSLVIEIGKKDPSKEDWEQKPMCKFRYYANFVGE